MKSILKTITCVLLIAVVVLALVGCNQAGESVTQEGDGEITQQELVEKAISAQEGVKTSQFDMKMSVDMSGETSEQKLDMSMAYDMSGKVDRVNKRMQMTVIISMDMPQQEEDSQSVQGRMTIYSLADAMYMKMSVPGTPEQWTKSPMPEGSWENRINQQIELLEESQIAISGEETVENVSCYAVEFTPSKEKMWELIQQQWPGQTTQDKPSNLDEIIQSMDLKQWIDKDTFLPVKEETQITMEISPEAMQMPTSEGGKMEMTMDIVANYHSYNEPVSIELPPEAENAEMQTTE
ncbi:MAG: DUF6612 family protein [Dehalococcoidia bacterium]